jgi:GTPase SAR1 family protein
MTPEQFDFDLFLSYGAQDWLVVKELATRLRGDGLRVWFDEWVLRPGDNIPAKIDDGLERSRILVLCMSAAAFGSDWSRLEAGTFRFRDPLNTDRRFIPLRLDDAPIKGSLAQFLYISWRPNERQQSYRRLLDACRSRAASDERSEYGADDEPRANRIHVRLGAIDTYALSGDFKRILVSYRDGSIELYDQEQKWHIRSLKGHKAVVYQIIWSRDQRSALSCSEDGTIRLWNIHSGQCVATLKLGSSVNCVGWFANERYVISGSDDNRVRVWDISSERCQGVLKGHTDRIWSVSSCDDRFHILSGAEDHTLRLWDAGSNECLHIFEGHSDLVRRVVLSKDGSTALSASQDGTVRLWNVETGRCIHVMEGHKDGIADLAVSADETLAISGSGDDSVRIWDLKSGNCLRIFRDHHDGVRNVGWSQQGLRAFSGDGGAAIRVWDLTSVLVSDPVGHTKIDQVQYTNAKVLLVGDSGVGKSGLSGYLAHGVKVQPNVPLLSTDGAWATRWPLSHEKIKRGVKREIWLWDFAGQVDYRLVYQLFMDDTAAAVFVFNPQSENPFEGLSHWSRDLQKAARRPFAKLLAAGRIDRGGLVISSSSMQKFMEDHQFLMPLHLTSAVTGEGCDALRERIVDAIDWESIPETTSPALYHRLKQEIIALRDSGLILIRIAELNQRMRLTLLDQDFDLSELETVADLLSGPGMVKRLDFGGFILLRPEVLSRYAAAVVRKVRKHPQEIGCIREDDLLAGDLDYQDFTRLPPEDEAVVLRALLEIFVSRAWCLRQPCDSSAMLTFPSYFRRERPEQPSHPSVMVSYRFSGAADDIYATLVVRLHYTVAFGGVDLWKSAADFRTETGSRLGIALVREPQGTSRIEVYFEPDVDLNSRVLFLRYVHDHLGQLAQDLVRLRHYSCNNRKCEIRDRRFSDQSRIDKALTQGGKGKVFCPACGKPIKLRDIIEEKFNSSAVAEQVRGIRAQGQIALDNERHEIIVAHHIKFTVEEAGHQFRSFTQSDHGLDGEIEFLDERGQATGRKVYVQLKPSSSYAVESGYDEGPAFKIKSARWADYWKRMQWPVMLVLRTEEGRIQWMDMRAYLKRQRDNGGPTRIVQFSGEEVTSQSVRGLAHAWPSMLE